MEDYEDAVAVVCAKAAGIDNIVTRDEEFQKSKTNITTVSSDDFVKQQRK